MVPLLHPALPDVARVAPHKADLDVPAFDPTPTVIVTVGPDGRWVAATVDVAGDPLEALFSGDVPHVDVPARDGIRRRRGAARTERAAA
jgi:hypothetical protein